LSTPPSLPGWLYPPRYKQVDSFMELFTADAEVIGTNGVKPGLDEWYRDRVSARELVEGDWQGWGDLRLDLDAMSVHQRGDVGWVAASATVTQIIGAENYGSYLEFVKKFLDDSKLSAEFPHSAARPR
jgi:hypothetical protein